MTEHDWRRIDRMDLARRICNTCVQCNCCDIVTNNCPGECVPSRHIDTPDFLFIPGMVITKEEN